MTKAIKVSELRFRAKSLITERWVEADFLEATQAKVDREADVIYLYGEPCVYSSFEMIYPE